MYKGIKVWSLEDFNVWRFIEVWLFEDLEVWEFVHFKVWRLEGLKICTFENWVQVMKLKLFFVIPENFRNLKVKIRNLRILKISGIWKFEDPFSWNSTNLNNLKIQSFVDFYFHLTIQTPKVLSIRKLKSIKILFSAKTIAAQIRWKADLLYNDAFQPREFFRR